MVKQVAPPWRTGANRWIADKPPHRRDVRFRADGRIAERFGGQSPRDRGELRRKSCRLATIPAKHSRERFERRARPFAALGQNGEIDAEK